MVSPIHYKTACVLVCFFIIVGHCLSQSENIEVEGGIKISAATSSPPQNGTIQWTGADFEGRTPSGWTSLTSGGSSGTAVSMYDGEFVNMLFNSNTSTVRVFNDRVNVWSSQALSFTMGTTDTPIFDTYGNFLIMNSGSATVHVYNSALNVWNAKTFAHNLEFANLVDAFTGNFMIRENNDDYHVYIADTDTWLPAMNVPPRMSAQAQKLKSASDDWN